MINSDGVQLQPSECGSVQPKASLAPRRRWRKAPSAMGKGRWLQESNQDRVMDHSMRQAHEASCNASSGLVIQSVSPGRDARTGQSKIRIAAN